MTELDLPVTEFDEPAEQPEKPFVPTHVIRSIKVMRVLKGGRYAYFDKDERQVVKGRDDARPIRGPIAKALRDHLETVSFSDEMDLADLLPKEDLEELVQREKEPQWFDEEFDFSLLGLCLEALRFSRAVDVKGNTACIVDANTVKLSVYKGNATGGCRHYLIPIPEKITLHCRVLEW